MTQPNPFEGVITTPAEFQGALTALIVTAHANDLTVGKPWVCHTDDGTPNWEATIVELEAGSGDQT